MPGSSCFEVGEAVGPDGIPSLAIMGKSRNVERAVRRFFFRDQLLKKLAA